MPCDRKPTRFIAGNGERAVLEIADGTRPEDWPTGRWLVERHGADGLNEIRSWPATIAGDVAGLGAVRLCHGSPRSDIELLTPQTSPQRIAEATRGIEEPPSCTATPICSTNAGSPDIG